MPVKHSRDLWTNYKGQSEEFVKERETPGRVEGHPKENPSFYQGYTRENFRQYLSGVDVDPFESVGRDRSGLRADTVKSRAL